MKTNRFLNIKSLWKKKYFSIFCILVYSLPLIRHKYMQINTHFICIL